MSTRQGPGNNPPGLVHDTITIHPRPDSKIDRRSVWVAHDSWWGEPANLQLVDAAIAADRVEHRNSHKARPSLDRVKHIADHIIRMIAKHGKQAADSTIDQMAADTCMSADMVRSSLRVLISAGVVVNLTANGHKRIGGKGRAPKRTLIYLIESPPISTREMRGEPNRNEGDVPITPRELPNKEKENTLARNVTLVSTADESDWKRTLTDAIESNIATTQRRESSRRQLRRCSPLACRPHRRQPQRRLPKKSRAQKRLPGECRPSRRLPQGCRPQLDQTQRRRLHKRQSPQRRPHSLAQRTDRLRRSQPRQCQVGEARNTNTVQLVFWEFFIFEQLHLQDQLLRNRRRRDLRL